MPCGLIHQVLMEKGGEHTHANYGCQTPPC